MKSVYIVTSGCYSDYAIRAVFSTEEDADAYVLDAPEEGYSSDERRVETFDLDAEACPGDAYQRISVVLAENGDTLDVTTKDVNETKWWRWWRAPDPKVYPAYSGRQGVCFEGVVWARDVDQAIKIARDVRAMSVAAGDLEKLHANPAPHFVRVEASR